VCLYDFFLNQNLQSEVKLYSRVRPNGACSSVIVSSMQEAEKPDLRSFVLCCVCLFFCVPLIDLHEVFLCNDGVVVGKARFLT
jgi:hypothetical protein